MQSEGGLQERNETVKLPSVSEYEKHYCGLTDLCKDLENISDFM